MPKNLKLDSNSATCESSPNLSHKFKEDLRITPKIKKPLIPKHIFLSKILEEITFENKQKKEKLVKNCFYMRNLPNLIFSEFVKRIFKYLKPESSTIIISLIYIDIFLNVDKENLFLTENNIYKIYLAAIILAIKYNEDYFDDNQYFSKVGGVSLTEINTLEREFLKIIDYRLFVNENLFKVYEDNFVDCEK